MPLAGNPIGPLTLLPGYLQYFFGGIIPPPYGNGITEVAEALTQGSKSITLVVPGTVARHANTQRQISWSTLFPSLPTSATITLQGAMRDVDAEYIKVDESTELGETRTIDSNLTFFRILVTAASGGTNPTIIAKARAM